MKMSIGSLINQGNACFLAGKQIDAMMYYIDVLKKAGAFESVVKYVNKHREDLYENQRILHQLFSTKYHLHFIPGTLPFFLITIKNQLEEMERKEDYQRFKKLMLAKHPKTVEQIIDVFLDEYEEPSSKEKEFLLRVFKDHGMNYSLYDVDGLCTLRAHARDLNRFECSLDWKESKTFTDIDVMTGFEFEDFIVDLFIKLGYVVKKQKRTREQGLDLLLLKHGIYIVVQAKRQRRPVGNRAVQQALAACAYYHGQQAIVVTNSKFTLPAKQLAARCTNVELWDRPVLEEKIKRVWGTF